MDSIQAGKLILNSEVPNSIWKPPSSYFFCPWVNVKSCWQLKDAALEAWSSVDVSVLSPRQEICFDAIIIGPESDLWECLSVTHWLAHSCLVNLIDVTLACEDGNSKLVVTVWLCLSLTDWLTDWLTDSCLVAKHWTLKLGLVKILNSKFCGDADVWLRFFVDA